MWIAKEKNLYAVCNVVLSCVSFTWQTTFDDTVIGPPLSPGPGSSNGNSSRPSPHSSRPPPSPPPQPPQQQQQQRQLQELGPMRIQKVRKRQATATITPYQQQVLRAIAKEENEHEPFLLSFASTLARLEPRKQALVKCRMQSLFFNIELGEEWMKLSN